MLLALSSNQKLGLALVAGAFVVFALVSAVVIPRSNPDFPGRRLNLFVGASIVFTVAMLAAVAFIARETGEESAAGETTPTMTETTPTESTETQPPATPEPTTTTEATTTESAGTTTTETAPAGDATAGKAVFTSAGCVSCHTLADAGATGTVGPDLDAVQPSYDKVVERVTEGKSPMPSFKGTLTPAQIQDVAAYVSSVAGS